jgi:DNA-directed RNA polymerase specialized sigma24 family protein
MIVALDEALSRLEKESPRAYQLVELKFFAGLSFEEAALAMDVSSRTLKRDWEVAKRWLYRELRQEEPPSKE